MLKSCGIIPVKLAGEGPQFLLLRSWSHWDFPKGHMEDGETHLECALREFQEESGIDSAEFDWGTDRYYETEPFSKPKKIARYYLGKVAETAEPKLLPNPQTGKVEHEEFGWFSFDEARKLVKPRILKALEFARTLVESK